MYYEPKLCFFCGCKSAPSLNVGPPSCWSGGNFLVVSCSKKKALSSAYCHWEGGTNLVQSKNYWRCGFVTHSECSCEGFWGIGVQGEAAHVFPNFELAGEFTIWKYSFV